MTLIDINRIAAEDRARLVLALSAGKITHFFVGGRGFTSRVRVEIRYQASEAQFTIAFRLIFPKASPLDESPDSVTKSV